LIGEGGKDFEKNQRRRKSGSIFVLGRNFRRAAAAPPQARAARPGA